MCAFCKRRSCHCANLALRDSGLQPVCGPINKQRLAKGPRGVEAGTSPDESARTKTPKTISLSGLSKQTSPNGSASQDSFFHPDFYCRPRNFTGSCCSCKGAARGLYHRSGISPCPEGLYSVVPIITQLRFADAIDRAGSHAAGRIKVAHALHTGVLVDHIQRAIAFADRLGRAIRDTCTASNAIFADFHGHSIFSIVNSDAMRP